MNYILKKAQNQRDLERRIYRKLHENPELSFQEFETSKVVKEFLTNEGIIWKDVGDTGIVAIIKGSGNIEKEKVIALRADMDALQVTEETFSTFSSKNQGVMHACGHDVHTTALLMATKILNEERNKFSGTVKCIFQPAEELVMGALSMIEKDDFMKDCDEIIGCHVNGSYPTGTFAFVDGGAMFGGEMFEILIRGKSGHGAQPDKAVDALLTASAVVMNSQAIISRETSPLDSAVITICTLQSGTRHNIMAGDARLTGTIRFYSGEKRLLMKEALTRMVENTAKVYGASGVVNWDMYVPPVINDKMLGKVVKEAIVELVGENGIVNTLPMTGSDDFAYYLDYAKGYYIFMGCKKEEEVEYPIHHSKFIPDEESITFMSAAFANIAIKLLQNN